MTGVSALEELALRLRVQGTEDHLAGLREHEPASSNGLLGNARTHAVLFERTTELLVRR